MRYTVTTFKVRLEVCDVGERTGASEDVVVFRDPSLRSTLAFFFCY